MTALLLPLAWTGCGPSPAPSASPSASPSSTTSEAPSGSSSKRSPGITDASSAATVADTRKVGKMDGEWFEEITERSGVRFEHRAGTNYFMPDQVGSGVALLDADGDGRLDIYLVQNAGPKGGGKSQLFHQEADGTFHNVSAGSGADLDGPGMGVTAGDVNNDGRPDLVVTEYGATRLLANAGGMKFVEVGPASGIDNPRWAAAVSFIDFDRDGWLDLVVGNYLDYDPTQICYDVQGRRDFCAPSAYQPTPTRLWHNVTGTPGAPPRFEEVTEHAGLAQSFGVTLGLICADIDGDAWPDIFCADDGRPNRLFLNRHDGTFVEEAVLRGLALNSMGRTAANMGVAFADVDGDGLGDIFVTHLAEEFHALFRQDRRGWFSDAIAPSGLQQQGWRGTGFGTVLVDFDCDGDPDLVFVNGLVRRFVPGQTPVLPGVDPWWARYAQRAQIFRNEGKGRFVEVSAANPTFCGLAQVGRSLALGDLDNDGHPDLVVGTEGGPARVFLNRAHRDGHWLKLRLLDPAAGQRDAIGAEVVVRTGERRQWALLQPATSYVGSHEPAIYLGLGAASSVDSIEVLWPDGTREQFDRLSVDHTSTLLKGSGRKGTP